MRVTRRFSKRVYRGRLCPLELCCDPRALTFLYVFFGEGSFIVVSPRSEKKRLSGRVGTTEQELATRSSSGT